MMKIINELEQISSKFMQKSPLNLIKEMGSLKIFDPPIFAIASTKDPIFELLKEETVIGPHHMKPEEWLPGALTVVTYFLPFSYKIREANHKQGIPAIEWLYGRIEGECFNKAFREFLNDWFIQKGYQSVAPSSDSRQKTLGFKSNWSERHAAYIAGLGTFGLSCSLITAKGSAGRLGSLITNADLEITKRPYVKREEYCAHCCACIFRCPPLAIHEEGKDHQVCSDYLSRVKTRFNPRYGCGKCQTNVPCEDKIPKQQ